ncbi:MAG: hypothetical protein EPN93_19895 [Spirochaetes bacterium]|nr:MAG: hypothetical protein EPN93_19895 [Spirochaetota bacterium]
MGYAIIRKGILSPARAWCAVMLTCVFAILVPDRALAGNARSQDWFWMIYETDNLDHYRTTVVRPFYMKNHYAGGKTFDASLMPLGFWRYAKDGSSDLKSLFGLVESVDYTHTDGIEDYDLGIFPLLFYGDSAVERDRYLMVLPVGGTVKGKLAQDRISAYAFPGFMLFFIYPPATLWSAALLTVASLIPAYADYETRDFHARAIFWPLIQWGSGPGRDEFRILPLYAHNYKKGVYDNYSYLFIFNEQNVRVGNDTQRTLFAMPFYGRRWNDSGEGEGSTLLWPLFSWGFNRKSGDFELNFPWPLVMIQDSTNPSIYKRIFFPFYGKYLYGSKETFFVSPLYFTLKHTTESFSSEYYINALVVWYFKRDYPKSPDKHHGSAWRYFKVWPLFHYEYDSAGNSCFNMLSLLPFRDPDGYELMYQPFWTLFEYRKLTSGEKRLGLLLRTYYQRWGEDFMHIKVPILFTFRTEGDVVTQFSVLASMFGYERDRKGTSINLFWIPVRINQDGVALRDETRDTDETDDLLIARIDGRNHAYTGDFARPAMLTTDDRIHYSARLF